MQEINAWIQHELTKNIETEYQIFTSKLIPGTENVLGIRLPVLRKMAKKLAKGDWKIYLDEAMDSSMEEIMLQGMTLGYVNASFQDKVPYLDSFILKIDNWSVCDSTCTSLKPQSDKDMSIMWDYIVRCTKDEREFVIRFGLVMMLDHFILNEYIDEVLQKIDETIHDGYYVKMAAAWAISICFIKFKEKTLIFLRNNHLDDFTYNKSLQKITESFQVSKEDKQLIRSMKRIITIEK